MENSFLRTINNRVVSNLENFSPNSEIVTGLNCKRHFHHSVTGKRLLIGTIYYNTPDECFMLKISEEILSLHADQTVPYFTVIAWENLTDEQIRERFNLGNSNSCIIDKVYAYGIDELNAAILNATETIKKFQEMDRIHVEKKQKAELAAKLEEKTNLFNYCVDASLETGLKKYNKSSKKKKIELVEYVKNKLTEIENSNDEFTSNLLFTNSIMLEVSRRFFIEINFDISK